MGISPVFPLWVRVWRKKEENTTSKSCTTLSPKPSGLEELPHTHTHFLLSWSLCLLWWPGWGGWFFLRNFLSSMSVRSQSTGRRGHFGPDLLTWLTKSWTRKCMTLTMQFKQTKSSTVKRNLMLFLGFQSASLIFVLYPALPLFTQYSASFSLSNLHHCTDFILITANYSWFEFLISFPLNTSVLFKAYYATEYLS